MSEQATIPSRAGEDADLRGTTILLVDDNVQNLELMQAYLEALPCQTVAVTDGLQAVRRLETEPPDMVLLDVMMPRMSGFEVCQKIKAHPDTRDIPVIMVTALHEVGDVERAIEAGTDDFLTKPINKLELLTRVRSLMRVRLLKRQLEQLTQREGRVGPDCFERGAAGEKLEQFGYPDQRPDRPTNRPELFPE